MSSTQSRRLVLKGYEALWISPTIFTSRTSKLLLCTTVSSLLRKIWELFCLKSNASWRKEERFNFLTTWTISSLKPLPMRMAKILRMTKAASNLISLFMAWERSHPIPSNRIMTCNHLRVCCSSSCKIRHRSTSFYLSVILLGKPSSKTFTALRET